MLSPETIQIIQQHASLNESDTKRFNSILEEAWIIISEWHDWNFDIQNQPAIGQIAKGWNGLSDPGKQTLANHLVALFCGNSEATSENRAGGKFADDISKLLDELHHSKRRPQTPHITMARDHLFLQCALFFKDRAGAISGGKRQPFYKIMEAILRDDTFSVLWVDDIKTHIQKTGLIPPKEG